MNLFLKLDEFLLRKILGLSPFLSCILVNIRQIILFRSRTKFYYSKRNNLFFSKDNKRKLYFVSLYRQVRLHSRGISSRIKSLSNDYFIDMVDINDNDNVVDCGANIGEIYYAFLRKNKKLNYFGFEPSPKEYKALEINAFGQKNMHLALSDKSSFQNFFISSEEADNSLIKPNYYTETIKIKTERLDKIMPNKKIKFLKIDAEGAELEVLKGCLGILKNIKYISADLGPERGINSEPTYKEVIPFLKGKGFSIINLRFRRYTFLFLNERF